MKKKLSILLAILLILTVFTGCSNDRAEKLAFVQEVVNGFAFGLNNGGITITADGEYLIAPDFKYGNITYEEIIGSSPNLEFFVGVRDSSGPAAGYIIKQDGKGGFILNGDPV